MKHQIFIILIISFMLLLIACQDNSPTLETNTQIVIQEELSIETSIAPEQTSTAPTVVEKPLNKKPTKPTEPPKLYANYYGRLHIPEIGVNVALYYGASQAITDRKDSANIFSMSMFNGLYIADHNTQAFKKLHKVLPGTKGYIELQNGDIRYIECIDIFDGYNTGKLITNKSGQTNFQADYLMYTCKKGQNIVICLWNYN